MTATLIIPGRLPGFNEYSDKERIHRQTAAKFKKATQETIGWSILQQLRGVSFDKPVWITYRWFEPNRLRDKSNTSMAMKFIEDALVECRVLKGDGWARVEGFEHHFAIDKNNPRVEVIITDEL